MNEFFSNALSTLNIKVPDEYIIKSSSSDSDIIDEIVSKYSNHPSIKLINENVKKGSFSFETVGSIFCFQLTSSYVEVGGETR